jgi:hypothetical protein
MSQFKKGGICAIITLMAAWQFTAPAMAQNAMYMNPYYNYANPYYTNPYYANAVNRQYFGPAKKVEDAAIGAGLGAAAGAAAGGLSGQSALKGGLVGAGTGAGIGLVKSSATLYNHPILKKTLYGTAIGTGLGFATTGSPKDENGTAISQNGETPQDNKKKIEKEAAIGGALGLGMGLLTNPGVVPAPGSPYRY